MDWNLQCIEYSKHPLSVIILIDIHNFSGDENLNG